MQLNTDEPYIELTECIDIGRTARMKCIFCGIYMDYLGKYRFVLHKNGASEERVIMYFMCSWCKKFNSIRFNRDERN